MPPVYDIARSQILAQPVTASYEGKALRAGLRAQELQNKALEQDIELAPVAMGIRQQEADTAGLKAQIDLVKLEREIGKDGLDGLMDSFAAGMAIYEKTGSPEQAYEVTAQKLASLDPDLDPEEARAALDQETGGQFDPDTIGAFLMTADEHRQRGRGSEELVNVRYPDGRERSFRKDDKKLDAAIEAGAVRVSPTQKTLQTDDPSALWGGTGDKTQDRKITEAVTSAETLVTSVKRITEQVAKMPQSAMGLPGATARLVDNTASAISGFAELFGGVAQINGEEVPEQFLLDTKLYQDMFEGPAAQSAVLQSMQVGLAYALARSANPDGRLSDADVRSQMNRVRLSGSSKTQIEAVLVDIQHEVMGNTANTLRISGATKTKEGKAYYDQLMGELESLEGAADEQPGAVRVIASDDDYEALPSGAMFRAPDGTLRRKP